MSAISNIIPNINQLNLQQEDINKLNQLFSTNSNPLSFPDSDKMLLSTSTMQVSKTGTKNSCESTLKNNIQTSLFNIFNQTQKEARAHSNDHLPVNERKKSKKIEEVASLCIQKSEQMREQNLISQLNYVKQQLQTLQKHVSHVNRKYGQKREQANTYMLKFLEQKDKNEDLINKCNRMQKQTREQKSKIASVYNERLAQQNQQFLTKQSEYITRIQKLQTKIRKLEQLMSFTDMEYHKIKQLLILQTNKRNNKEQQFAQSQREHNQSITALKQSLSKCQSQLSKRYKQIYEKDEYIASIQKSFKQLNKRMLAAEDLNKKQLMREKAIAKKAIDGLEMTRKYSELELTKSKKKEKDFIHKQKELIAMIKQITKNNKNTCDREKYKQKERQRDKSILDTADISLRKSEIKSLNTTLMTNNNRRTSSPLVSKFQIEDIQHINQLSPINPNHRLQKQRQNTLNVAKQQKQSRMKNNRSTSRLELKTKKNFQHKDIYKNNLENKNLGKQSSCASINNSGISSLNISLDVFARDNSRRGRNANIQTSRQGDLGAGTPCFEIQNNDKLFRANKKY